MKLEFSRQILGKCSNLNFHKNPPVAAELFHTDKQTGITKLRIAFRDFRTLLKTIYPSFKPTEQYVSYDSRNMHEQFPSTALTV
jgi:hypothetical protein